MAKKVSIIIPSRNERFLQQTVDDITRNARGDYEIIAILDGAWANPPLRDTPRLIQVHWAESRGMRAGINAGARMAKGDYLLKCDGHVAFAEGFDVQLTEDCPSDAVMVPRRYRLDPEAWENIEDGRPPVDYHYLSYPFERPGDPTCGLHGTVWNERAKERQDILIDEEMSSQGSCWFMPKRLWKRLIGPLDDKSYGVFAQEFQEIGLRAWLGGGQVLVNKKTWYSHLHKGRKYGTGYQFTTAQWDFFKAQNKLGHDHTIDFWLNNRWEQRVRDFEWLIEHFSPVPSWPEDWRERLEEFRRAKAA